MATRRFFMGLAVASIFVIGIWLLGFVSQATAETLNFKTLNHVTKMEKIPIAGVEGHFISVMVREGVTVYENGELAWVKNFFIRDLIKGAGMSDAYFTTTFLDGSSLTAHVKGTIGATPQGVTAGSKYIGEIIHGTGRFQGIKGTITTSSKVFPAEQGEPEGKALAEGTLVYTLSSK